MFLDFFAAASEGEGIKSSRLFDFPFKVKFGSIFRRSRTNEDLKKMKECKNVFYQKLLKTKYSKCEKVYKDKTLFSRCFFWTNMLPEHLMIHTKISFQMWQFNWKISDAFHRFARVLPRNILPTTGSSPVCLVPHVVRGDVAGVVLTDPVLEAAGQVEPRNTISCNWVLSLIATCHFIMHCIFKVIEFVGTKVQ